MWHRTSNYSKRRNRKDIDQPKGIAANRIIQSWLFNSRLLTHVFHAASACESVSLDLGKIRYGDEYCKYCNGPPGRLEEGYHFSFKHIQDTIILLKYFLAPCSSDNIHVSS